MAHVIAGCSALAQSKYLEGHNAALKVLYFELLRDLKLVDEVPPWYSKVQPKPLYESQDVQAFWDIPVFAEQGKPDGCEDSQPSGKDSEYHRDELSVD